MRIMKDIASILLFFLVFTLTAFSKDKYLPEPREDNVYTDSSRPVEERVTALLSRLTLEEKASLFSGRDFWHLEGIDRLGIPSIQVTDCGHGVTVILNDQGQYTGCATCFPTGVAQGASWNRDLLYDIGSTLARETRATGSTVLLAPMVNIHRTPLNGRNYETFSEDPFLTGELAAAFIQGAQSEHIGACIKAMTANNQQTNQHDLNVKVSERALREIYLPGFRIPIKESDPWAVMTAYNAVNRHSCAENAHLISDILKTEWTYPGLVVSDWRSVSSIKSLAAGLDLEMPGPGKFMQTRDILNALRSGLITEDEIDAHIKRILRLLIRSKLLDRTPSSLNAELNSPRHKTMARMAAEESIVLLKNDSGTLPLSKSRLQQLVVIGPNANEARLGGGGSASVTACYTVSPLEGIRNYCKDAVEISFEEGGGLAGNLSTIPAEHLLTEAGSTGDHGLSAEYYNGKEPKGKPALTRIDTGIDFSWGWAAPGTDVNKTSYSVRWRGKINPPVTGTYKIGLTRSGAGARMYINGNLAIDEWGDPAGKTFEARYEQTSTIIELDLAADSLYDIQVEFYKRMNRNLIRLEWEVPGKENPISQAVTLAEKCDATVIFAGLSNYFEGGNNDRDSLALPGDQNRLISRIAEVNSRTIVVLINGTPVSMPWADEVNAIVEAYYPGQEGGNALANILFGETNPSGKLPETFPKNLEDNPSFDHFPGSKEAVVYEEGIYVGYRHYDTRNIPPLFPFGHGLSYTEFEYNSLEVNKPAEGQLTVQFTVKNTGDVTGKEVPQLYVRDIQSTVDRPPKELKEFTKLQLQPGELQSVVFELDSTAFTFYSESEGKWVIEPGRFELLIGSSSRDIRLWQTVHLP